MNSSSEELKQIATQLLAGMLSNPHIYTGADGEVRGQQEQTLVLTAIEMAEILIEKVEQRPHHPA
ncbi:hypothetical protein [Leptothermofonsia sp. ETS-13]|uniref:hypothetical protein n=1 Tax=Leptothermofonsia sp. ETS-13 TaxID=3035696 RepID=UPI003BA1A0EC